MKAVAYYQSLPSSDPQSLQDIELPAPTPGPRDLLVQVRAISVNPVDTKIRSNVTPTDGQAKVLGWDPYHVVKTLIMQDQDAKPLVVLMHGNRKVSTKNLARQIGAKSVEPCAPEVANRHSGYLVGGTSPFGTRRDMPVYIEESILGLPRIAINGGRRGFLVQIDPRVCVELLGARPVQCALAE